MQKAFCIMMECESEKLHRPIRNEQCTTKGHLSPASEFLKNIWAHEFLFRNKALKLMTTKDFVAFSFRQRVEKGNQEKSKAHHAVTSSIGGLN